MLSTILLSVAGVIGYLGVIIGISYVHGRMKPNVGSMEDLEIIMTMFWPATLVLYLPILGFCLFINFAENLRIKGQAQKIAQLDLLREQQRIQNRVNNLEMFEDDNIIEEEAF